MSSYVYRAYYRVNKETGNKEYLRTNMFGEPALDWTTEIDKADKYSSYDSFVNNAKAFGLEVDVDKYDYDFEEVR